MQGALAASLLPNPSSSSSSSSSSSRSFPPISSSSDVPHHLHLKDEEDEAINPLHLQTLELERFRQERKDRALCESERRRVAFDLKRRIHDQAFASEIHQMRRHLREADCRRCLPRLSSSSSASAVLETGEPFRLYFKGLVSTEQVNQRPVSMAGMGIAVCDPGDNLLLRIQKPLLGAGFTQGIVGLISIRHKTRSSILHLQEEGFMRDFRVLSPSVLYFFDSVAAKIPRAVTLGFFSFQRINDSMSV